MLLALDIGNTNLTVGLFRAGALLATRRAATNPRATTDEVELLLDGLLRLDGIAIADLDAIALASVVPALTGAVGDDVATAQISVGDGLLEQRSEQVEHVRPARHDAVIDEELGGGRARHPASPRWAEGDAGDGTARAGGGRP